jgi:formin 2
MRTTTLRLLQTTLALGSLAILTGANDPGCSSVSTDATAASDTAALSADSDAAADLACAAGTHVEAVCAPPPDGSAPPALPDGAPKGDFAAGGAPPKHGKGPKGGACQAACVPDPVCGASQKALWVCGGPPPHGQGDKGAPPPPKAGVGGAADGQGAPPPPKGAGLGGAPPGGDFDGPPPKGGAGDFDGPPPKGGAGGGDCDGAAGAPKGPPPGCHLVCVDVAPCGDGYADVVACADPPKPPPKGEKGAAPPAQDGVGGAPATGERPPLPEGCEAACMPAAPCADGSVAIDVCAPPPKGGHGGPPPPKDGAGGAPPAKGEGAAPPDGAPPPPPCAKVCVPAPAEVAVAD